MNVKKVLIITYYWPPAGGGGVQRWFHFANFLQQKGIDITVLTVNEKDASYPLIDQSLVSKTHGIKTIRTKSKDLLKLYSLLTSGNKKSNIPYGGIEKKGGVIQKIAAWVRANLFIPDARLGWNKYAIKAAKELLNADFSHIITTGPPQSSHLIGYHLKKIFPEIKWLADLRDPWTELYINETLPQSLWAKKRNQKLELQCFNTADKIITVGNEMKALLATKTKTPIDVIYNGFEEVLFSGLQYVPSKEFTILHIGLLGASQETDAFAKALKQIADANPTVKLKFVAIGKVSEENETALKNIDNLAYENLGYKPQKEAIAAMFKADLLLNITPNTTNERIMISTKTMEYLRCQRPVLVLSNEPSEFKFLFKNEPLLKTANRNNADDIHKAISFILDGYLRNKNQQSQLNVKEYSREAATEKLLTLLNN